MHPRFLERRIQTAARIQIRKLDKLIQDLKEIGDYYGCKNKEMFLLRKENNLACKSRGPNEKGSVL